MKRIREVILDKNYFYKMTLAFPSFQAVFRSQQYFSYNIMLFKLNHQHIYRFHFFNLLLDS